jgi:flagellar basal-body rod modification protein FlgD
MSTVGSVGTSADQLSTTSQSRNKLAQDMDTFLTLLTSQLKNQDPLSPMDSTEFTNQLVQFAQVEQQISYNEKLDSLIGLTVGSQAATAVQYIGLDVEAESSLLPVQEGKGRFAYGLTEDAKSVGIIIQDSAGKTVFTAAGDTSAGVHEFKWDGKDKDGNQLDDGTYRISITALDQDGASIDTWSTIFGTVTGVTSQDGETILTLGKVGVSLDNILSVSPKGSQAAASSEVTTDDGTTTDDTTTDDTATDDTATEDGGTGDDTEEETTA